MKTNLFGLFRTEIEELVTSIGLEKYRSLQILEWMYRRGVYDFQQMTNLPANKRKLLSDVFSIEAASLNMQQNSSDGKTSKYLLGFSDGEAIETVLMRQPYGNSVCVSSQVGCSMGCIFCASTLHGAVRNLTAGEMLAQVLYVNQLLRDEGKSVSNIVIMGSGEPLVNYEHVVKFIRLCHEDYCLNLSYRNITLSTSGVVPAIDRLSQEGLPITLSISLHAPDNNIRSKLMPINQHYSILDVVAAGSRYSKNTGRRVTYEYILIAGINDQPEHAKQLAELLQGQLCNVNLIPVNNVLERGLHRPAMLKVNEFERILLTHKTNVTVRREMGADIQAACGQLRNKALKTIQ
ncbi:23S rRNA (adenine(2503)-C(2))-methyltransferase RlmN [bacterium BFN5]|nr:23S rRNA (adenine(2503)-C(2))-methyltransferase RlmN [bacterium BFN5]QJW46976.1 23S rRNA (adenine(2503)-C(2))-methyltransferase RlmN [bacterium BFN5]